ncbi:MAG: NAD(P)H-dependent glycerol-3-phosphate dehydrogenase [Halothiobacillaceae bacterium]
MEHTTVVVGAGSWGTALALRIGRDGAPVWLVGRDRQVMEEMAARRENARYLPGHELGPSIRPTTDLERAVDEADQIWLVLPTSAIAPFIDQWGHVLPAGAGYVSASKGFEHGTGRRISEMISDALPNAPFAVLSGPSFAAEVAAGVPSAVAVASADPKFAHAVADRVHGHRFRAYTTSDVLGVELGGSLKNVLAIAAGVSDGFRFGANARAALITRGLAEIMRLGDAMGAQRQTLMGMAGMGDLVLTCTDDQSRNRRLGLLLAEGLSPEAACDRIGQTVEGIHAAAEVRRLAGRHGVDMPISAAVQQVLFDHLPARKAVEALLDRDQRDEGV